MLCAFGRLLVLVLVVGASSSKANGQVLNPVNGHHYRFVASNLNWGGARTAAESALFQGVPGHLATVADQAEQTFLGTLSLPDRVWIGGYQDTNHPSYSEPAGGWVRITGEPFVYTNWRTPGEPNNSPHNEDVIEMNSGSTVWNDISNGYTGSDGYIIEWEPGTSLNYCTPANVNSTGIPASMSMSGSSLLASNDLILEASNLPLSSFGFFLTSLTQGFVSNPASSQGNLCLGGAIGRYVGPGQIQNSGSSGAITLQIDNTQQPTPTGLVAIAPGETWHYTAWYRDALFGTVTSNFTDGLSVVFL